MIGLALALLGCQSAEFPAPVEGTAYRIEDDAPNHDGATRIDVLANRAQCVDAGVDDVTTCLPYADRASAAVRLAFRLVDPVRGAELTRALRPGQLTVTHDEAIQETVELVPHEPVSPSQLFVVLIDGSASMFANGGARIGAVRDALLRDSVVQTFYPDGGAATGVVLLRFTERVTGLDGGSPRILTDRDDYRQIIESHLLDRSRGYTHLYDAIRYASRELLGAPGIAEFVQQRSVGPTIVALTDGFHNEGPGELCRDNVGRLERTLRALRTARTDPSSFLRPTLYTIGLGRPYREGTKPPGARPPTVAELCGEYGDVRIGPTLESVGVDHVSLQWLAEA
ncbi:MAG: vWA domain-containing protein, partial [Myxococcota bacterium]